MAMLLSQLHKGDKAEIISITAQKPLRDRFLSFGIMKGEELIIKECSMAKQTIEISVGFTSIALRSEEAQKIKVKKIDK